MPVDRQDLRRRLFRLAAGQAGYFTAAQALEVGYSYQAQKHHADRNNWTRIDRGLFRIPDWPSGRFDDLVRWSLWARGEGVFSHETALAVHTIGDFDPAIIHMTVPATFRKRDPAVVLHVDDLDAADVESHDGFRITTPLRSMIDVAGSGADVEQLARAIDDARNRGRLTLRQLRERAEALDVRAALRIEQAINAMGTA